ncbi:MAG: GxxExxY protein [Flavobacteriaceae bacterium]
MTEDKISNIILGKAIEIHRILGLDFLELANQECLFYELINEGL